MAQQNDVVFATLTPANALTKLAFHDAFDDIMRQDQPSSEKGTERRTASLSPFRVGTEHEYSKDVLLLRLEIQRRKEQRQVEIEYSDSPTDINTDTELEGQGLGMIWTGCYTFAFQSAPADPNIGWAAGKGNGVDLCLATIQFAKNHDINLRAGHARFNFNRDGGSFFVAKLTRSPNAQVTVNGEPVDGRMHTLNQHRMRIRISSLEYVLEYTPYARSGSYQSDLETYMRISLQIPSPNIPEVPTPVPDTRTFGHWTVKRALGKGTYGKVFSASNTRDELVAIKVVAMDRRNFMSIRKQIVVLRELTRLAQAEREEGQRLVQLKETIPPGAEDIALTGDVFLEVALVLSPMTPTTLYEKTKTMGNAGTPKGMAIADASIFHEILLGLQWLHSHHWLHGDIKPENVGLYLDKAVLLDIDTAIRVEPGRLVHPTPGSGGTIYYLAPEREMHAYNQSVDIWSLGVIGYELTYGQAPWRPRINPWRPGPEHEALRPMFNEQYKKSMSRITRDIDEAAHKQLDNNLHLIYSLLESMLRHPFARLHNAQRINAESALTHPIWQSFTAAEQQTKRPRPMVS